SGIEPTSAERNGGGEYRRERIAFAIRFAASPESGEQVVQIGHQDIAQAECGRSFGEVGSYTVNWDGSGPDNSTFGNAGIVVVQLEIVFTKLVTGLEDIHSIKGKGAAMFLSIDSDIDTIHETYVGGKGKVWSDAQNLAGERIQLGSRSGALDAL